VNEPYEIIGPDPDNPTTHVMIIVRGVTYSVFQGEEQLTANDIATNLSAS
jgi:hypothetical protein